MNAEKLLIFYSSVNTPKKKDATGAFIPEARGFARHYMVPDEHVIGVDCTQQKRQRREKVLNALATVDGLEGLLFFGHGWPNGIQFGFTRKNLNVLSAAISSRCSDDIKVGLMACLTAENDVRDQELEELGPATDGGFADMLRDDLVKAKKTKGWVDGHKTAGHTSWNPYVVRFMCDADADAEGGAWIVQPGSGMWKRWREALKKNTGGLRYEFFRKDELAIKSYLDGLE